MDRMQRRTNAVTEAVSRSTDMELLLQASQREAQELRKALVLANESGDKEMITSLLARSKEAEERAAEAAAASERARMDEKDVLAELQREEKEAVQRDDEDRKRESQSLSEAKAAIEKSNGPCAGYSKDEGCSLVVTGRAIVGPS